MKARCKGIVCSLLVVLILAAPCRADETGGPLRLTLPPEYYAVPGVELNLYYENLVLTQTPEAYRFEVTCDLGEQVEGRWRVIPATADVGEHPLKVTVDDADGKTLGAAEMLLQVAPRDAGAERPLSLLIVGDSLTHATHYPNELARLLSLPENPRWTMLGTHRPSTAKTGVAHEGYGGWTWQRFATHHEPNPDGTYRKQSSPFVFLDDSGKPKLDPLQYCKKVSEGHPPDVVLFMLGINDCFRLDPENPESLDRGIDDVFEHAETLIAAFRAAAPAAKLGICLTTPPNAREEAFQANYKDKYPRWGWKRIQHRLVQRQLEQFGDRQQERIFIDPGIGFGKTRQNNLDLIANLAVFTASGYGVLLGASRKRFMGSICQVEKFSELVGATCATTALAVMAGVDIIRVHDVRENRQALDVAHALKCSVRE